MTANTHRVKRKAWRPVIFFLYLWSGFGLEDCLEDGLFFFWLSSLELLELLVLLDGSFLPLPLLCFNAMMSVEYDG